MVRQIPEFFKEGVGAIKEGAAASPQGRVVTRGGRRGAAPTPGGG